MLKYIVAFMQLQLFITLISWPILLWWGLPLSLASPVGNFIFSPFLAGFLMLSSLIFFCELCNIPNSFLITLLEYLTSGWLWFIESAQRSWLIAFAKPSLMISLALPVLTILLLHHKKLATNFRNTIPFALLICLHIGYLNYTTPTNFCIKKIPCFDNEITFIKAGCINILIDPGILGKRISSPSWVHYTLVPELIKTQSVTSLDYIIALRPSTMTFQALVALCRRLSVKKIYITSWRGKFTNSGWQAWEQLLSIIKKYNTQLILLDKEVITLDLADNAHITITPQQHEIKKNNLKYPRISITGTLQENNVHINSLETIKSSQK